MSTPPVADPATVATAINRTASKDEASDTKAVASANPTAGAEPKKVTAAELKAQKKAEKEKRRAIAIRAKEGGAVVPPQPAAGPSTPSRSDSKSGKQKTKHERSGSSGIPAGSKQEPPKKTPGEGLKTPFVAPNKPKPVDPRDSIPGCFSHLSLARRISITEEKDVHPAVLVVGQDMAAFALRDPLSRLEATLVAFKEVIRSYETPKSNALSRHFIPHVLNPQIEYLTECRPMCYAMGNGIRLLKAKVASIPPDMPDEDARDYLCGYLDDFIQEKICYAELAVIRNALPSIKHGSTIVTFGNQRLVRRLLEKAWSKGLMFSVIVLGDPYDPTGKNLANLLRELGVKVTYHPHAGSFVPQIRRATMALLGAEAILANGSLYGPAGTCDTAVVAKTLGMEVVTLCESVNIDRDRVATDSTTYNEVDPERSSGKAFGLLFDTTRDTFISTLITEYEDSCGHTPSQAVQKVLQIKEDLN